MLENDCLIPQSRRKYEVGIVGIITATHRRRAYNVSRCLQSMRRYSAARPLGAPRYPPLHSFQKSIPHPLCLHHSTGASTTLPNQNMCAIIFQAWAFYPSLLILCTLITRSPFINPQYFMPSFPIFSNFVMNIAV